MVAKVAVDTKKDVSVTVPEKKIENIKVDAKKGTAVAVPEKKLPEVKVASVDVKKEEPKKQPKETVNKIAVVIYTDDEPIMITKHSLDCKTLDGRVRSRDELVMEKLMCHEALNYYKIPITDDMVDKHLASLKEMHGIGDAEIKKLFKEAGYTYEEGRAQLRSSYAIQSLMG